jgi:hypothetical protein
MSSVMPVSVGALLKQILIPALSFVAKPEAGGLPPSLSQKLRPSGR